MAKIPLDSFQLQFISHQNEKMTYLDGIHEAITGLCRWVQLRMKDASDNEVRPIAYKVKELQIDGVHLGKNDMPIAEARKILGDDFIIGGTANTFEDVKAHYEAGADYIGCGPFRFTTTKEKLSPILGLEGYREIIQKMKAENIDIPIVAIGGITKEDIPEIMKTGVNGIALSGCILNAKNPASETHDIMEMMREFR